MYTLILITFYNCAPESVPTVGMDPVEKIIAEIKLAELAIYDICEAANNALGGGLFMAALTSDPSWAKNLALSKLYLLERYVYYEICKGDAHSKLWIFK